MISSRHVLRITLLFPLAIKRNLDRFPEDFMFELNKEEFLQWRSQIVTSIADRMGLRWHPYAFTEQGVAMLSSVLKSKRAVIVNIAIMRAFVKLREMLGNHKELANRLDKLEKETEKNKVDIKVVFDTLRQMLSPPEKPKKKIGFLRK